ncbi:MAG: hypothetical protein NVS3B21_15050 [Acidimicrobiales bacterium]
MRKRRTDLLVRLGNGPSGRFWPGPLEVRAFVAGPVLAWLGLTWLGLTYAWVRRRVRFCEAQFPLGYCHAVPRSLAIVWFAAAAAISCSEKNGSSRAGT